MIYIKIWIHYYLIPKVSMFTFFSPFKNQSLNKMHDNFRLWSLTITGHHSNRSLLKNTFFNVSLWNYNLVLENKKPLKQGMSFTCHVEQQNRMLFLKHLYEQVMDWKQRAVCWKLRNLTGCFLLWIFPGTLLSWSITELAMQCTWNGMRLLLINFTHKTPSLWVCVLHK